MAEVNTSVWKGNLTGRPANLGCIGCEVVRVTTDAGGAGTTTITLPANSSIKTITSVVTGGPANLAAGTTFPVAASTGFVLSFIAGNNGAAGIVDVLVFGKGT